MRESIWLGSSSSLDHFSICKMGVKQADFTGSVKACTRPVLGRVVDSLALLVVFFPIKKILKPNLI